MRADWWAVHDMMQQHALHKGKGALLGRRIGMAGVKSEEPLSGLRMARQVKYRLQATSSRRRHQHKAHAWNGAQLPSWWAGC